MRDRRDDRMDTLIETLKRLRADPRFRAKAPAQKFYEALAMTDSTVQDAPEWRDLSPAQQATLKDVLTTLLQPGREEHEDEEEH